MSSKKAKFWPPKGWGIRFSHLYPPPPAESSILIPPMTEETAPPPCHSDPRPSMARGTRGTGKSDSSPSLAVPVFRADFGNRYSYSNMKHTKQINLQFNTSSPTQCFLWNGISSAFTFLRWLYIGKFTLGCNPLLQS